MKITSRQPDFSVQQQLDLMLALIGQQDESLAIYRAHIDALERHVVKLEVRVAQLS